MDLVNSYRTASPSKQAVVAGIVSLIIFAVLLAAYFTVLRKPYEPLFTNLRAGDAAAVVTELEKKKTPYRLADGGTTIKVPADLVDKTRLDVMSSELPLKGAVGFELFNKSDMGLTEFAQKINYQRALQGELARTIMTMDAIETARVHLSIPEATIFRDDRVPPKASVTLLTQNGIELPPSTILGIQRLVAASVPELDVADVVILDSAGAVVSGGLEGSAGAPPASAQEKQAIEQYYTARIREAFDDGYAGKTTHVTVTADYDPAQLASGGIMRWAPYARRFPLKVSVFSDDEIPHDELRAVVAAALGRHHSGDTVTLAPLAAWRPAEATQGPVVATPVTQTTVHSVAAPFAARPAVPATAFHWAAIAALVAMAMSLGVYLYRRIIAPRRLSDKEKQAYVNRLRLLLEEGDANAIPSN